MKRKIAEILAVLVTLLGIIGATIWPFLHEAESVRESTPPGSRVITLTGVVTVGVWTEEEVHGGNYWNRTFSPARPLLRVGEVVRLRLKSADVIHTFYSPGLGVGPVEVYPGHVVEVQVMPTVEGVFEYYCTTVCGNPHFGMRGEIVVRRDNDSPPLPLSSSVERFGKYWLEPPPPAAASRVERGKWLYRQKGCFTCHGPEGQGGVPNWNYAKDTVPSLNTLADKMMLYEKEDAQKIIEYLEQGISLDSLEKESPVYRFNVVLAKYHLIQNVIQNGSPAGQKDPQGPLPPLNMPAWSEHLSGEDIDALIAYLLTLYPWEEEE